MKTQSIAQPTPPVVRACGDVTLRFRRSNARGWAMGESRHGVTASDAIVAKAREMRAAGMSHRRIGAELGVPWQTCEGWTSMRKRLPHARIVVTRVAPSKRSINPQASPMRQGLAFDRVGGYEVAATDSNTKGTP